MANEIGAGSYNKYPDLPNLAYNCIKHLMDNDETIWKLLKYNTPDALDLTDLTKEEKGSLIWKGEGDSSLFNVFMDDGAPDAEMKEISILRVFPYGISPDNRTVGTITMLIETYSHYKINTLSSYVTRTDSIIQRVLATLNGAEILGIGKLHFNKIGTSASRLELGGQLPFRGKWLLMGNKMT